MSYYGFAFSCFVFLFLAFFNCYLFIFFYWPLKNFLKIIVEARGLRRNRSHCLCMILRRTITVLQMYDFPMSFLGNLVKGSRVNTN